MAKKKKDNTKRNLAIGAGTVLAGGLALKNSKAIGNLARKAYDATKRIGKKRGKYKKENVTQYINRTQGKKKLTKAEKSALIKERVQKIFTGDNPKTIKRTKIGNGMEQTTGDFDEIQNLRQLNRNSELYYKSVGALEAKKKGILSDDVISRENLLKAKNLTSTDVRENVDRLRKLGKYSKQLYLISDFTFK